MSLCYKAMGSALCILFIGYESWSQHVIAGTLNHFLHPAITLTHDTSKLIRYALCSLNVMVIYPSFVWHVSHFQWPIGFPLKHIHEACGTTNNSLSSLSTGNSFGLRRHLGGLFCALHPSTLLFFFSLNSTPCKNSADQSHKPWECQLCARKCHSSTPSWRDWIQ